MKIIYNNYLVLTMPLMFLLNGCEGEPKENFTLSNNSVYVVAHNNPENNTTNRTWDHIGVNISAPKDELYIQIELEDSSLIDSYEVFKEDSSAHTQFSLTSVDFSQLSDGVHFDEVSVKACKDKDCKTQYRGSPQNIKVTISVAPESNPDTSCVHQEGNIFIDCVDPTWLGATGWELLKDGATDYHYFNGDNDFLIQWEQLDTQEEGYNTVLDIRFTDKPANGTFRFHPVGQFQTPRSPIDMSEYAAGSLEFDVRVLDWGDNNTSGLIATTECGWPCTSGEIALGTPMLNQWNHYSIDIFDILNDTIYEDFNLTKIEIGFSIFPAWDEMSGVHFQLDNVKWVK